MYGYPFKSKYHSMQLKRFKMHGLERKTARVYLGIEPSKSGKFVVGDHACPKILRYQFSDEFVLNISDECCNKLKKEPLKQWQKENNKPYAITGVMRAEGGQREHATCLAFSSNKLLRFNPLAPVSENWEKWLIREYDIKICDIYKPPYNFTRTGCKGCPFNIHLQKELETLKKYFPDERKQCEIIWGKVYEEYRRIGYRLPQRKRGTTK